MRISIIIPTLNEETNIERLLRFLCKHPANDQYEVIVVDGGSSDHTVEAASKYPVKMVETQTASRAFQMNRGAEQASGEVLYFVHADVQLPESFVADIEASLRDGFDAGCYRFRFIDKPSILLHINDFFTRFPFKWCRGGDQTLFITKELFENVGGFHEDYVIMEDYDMLDRIFKQASFKVLPKSVGVSSRKYRNNGYLKVQLANLKAMRMYKKGKAPVDIKNYYRKALNNH
ncbi:MAG: TIGR04283 family arsenosugar biosynthesis glycosyltransferase [Ekhidna sp.]